MLGFLTLKTLQYQGFNDSYSFSNILIEGQMGHFRFLKIYIYSETNYNFLYNITQLENRDVITQVCT